MAENNVFTRFGHYFIDQLGRAIASYIAPERAEALTKNKAYFEGVQKKPLKTKPGQADDNLIINWVGLAVNRSTSMLMGGGVTFTVPNDEVRQAWLDADRKSVV